jgi:hypothetical protein
MFGGDFPEIEIPDTRWDPPQLSRWRESRLVCRQHGRQSAYGKRVLGKPPRASIGRRQCAQGRRSMQLTEGRRSRVKGSLDDTISVRGDDAWRAAAERERLFWVRLGIFALLTFWWSSAV